MGWIISFSFSAVRQKQHGHRGNTDAGEAPEEFGSQSVMRASAGTAVSAGLGAAHRPRRGVI
jgi:hypothetical protein